MNTENIKWRIKQLSQEMSSLAEDLAKVYGINSKCYKDLMGVIELSLNKIKAEK